VDRQQEREGEEDEEERRVRECIWQRGRDG